MKGHATAPAPAGSFLPDTRGIRANIGGWAQLSVVQYFVAEAAVIEAWAGPGPYSRATGFISDLGAISCGIYEDRAVCSPLHWLMNASFVVQGLALVLGALFLTAGLLSVAARPGVTARRFRAVAEDSPQTRVLTVPWILAVAIRILTGVAGVGTVLVGLVPEDLGSPLALCGRTDVLHWGRFCTAPVGHPVVPSNSDQLVPRCLRARLYWRLGHRRHHRDGGAPAGFAGAVHGLPGDHRPGSGRLGDRPACPHGTKSTQGPLRKYSRKLLREEPPE